MIKYCSILHHSTIAQPFGRKNCFIWPFFQNCTKKYSLYTVSICIFDVKKFYSRYEILIKYCSILHQSTIVHLFGRKTASFDLFSKSCSKKYSLCTVSICIFDAIDIFSRYNLLLKYCSILHQSTIVHLFHRKIASFGLFWYCCYKKYSLYTVSICIFDAKKVFFEVRFNDGILFDTWSKHHCAPFWPKKLLHLAFFQKVAPKSTVYTLSWFAFLMPKKCILR